MPTKTTTDSQSTKASFSSKTPELTPAQMIYLREKAASTSQNVDQDDKLIKKLAAEYTERANRRHRKLIGKLRSKLQAKLSSANQ